MKLFVLIALPLVLLGQTQLDYKQVKNGPGVSAASFGAIGNDANDDTAAVQACINASVSSRSTCFLPSGIYKITGSGLTMPSSAASLLGSQAQGNATPILKYYGTGTALSIGTPSAPLIYGVVLKNIGILAASGVTAQYGINVNGLSDTSWAGVTVSAVGTGKFTTNIRFSDTSILSIDRLVVVNPAYSAGTTGVLFDQFVTYGNDQIYINTGDGGYEETLFNIKSCASCGVRDYYVENADYAILMDNTSAWSANSGVSNFLFDNIKFSTVGSGPTHHKVIQVNSTTGHLLPIGNMVIRSSNLYLSGGVTYPIELNIPSTAAGSTFNLTLDTNRIEGVVGAIVDSDNGIATVILRNNISTDNTGAGTTPTALHGTANLVDLTPLSSAHGLLNWSDSSGAQYMTGSSSNSMARPAASYRGPGLIQGVASGAANIDGFVRIGAGGGFPSSSTFYDTYCDWSGYSNTPDLLQNIACFAAGVEVFRLDFAGGQVLLSPSTVAALPTCTNTLEGTRRSVSNSNAASFTAGVGAVVVGGGSTHVPVYCDGSNWRIG